MPSLSSLRNKIFLILLPLIAILLGILNSSTLPIVKSRYFNHTKALDDPFSNAANLLQRLPLKYYMYDDGRLTFENVRLPPDVFTKLPMYQHETMYDAAMFAMLKHNQSGLRTEDPHAAELFIVPIPFSELISLQETKYLTSSLTALFNDSTYLQFRDRQHVILSSAFVTFRSDSFWNVGRTWVNWYPALTNFTLASSWDPNGFINAAWKGEDLQEYTEYARTLKPLTRRSFSMGLGTAAIDTGVGWSGFKKNVYNTTTLYCKDKKDRHPSCMLFQSNKLQFPLTFASIEKTQGATNFLFYHTRNTTSFWNSTIYRRAPLNLTLDKFPTSSIGYDTTNATEWKDHYQDSRFCLVVRGDSPHSHALHRSVRAGCIPVLISNCLELYSPVYKQTLHYSDYAVVLDEREVLADVDAVFRKLLEMSTDELKEKVRGLAFAQRVLFQDHPESLVVQAFLREAKAATEVLQNNTW